MPGPRRAARVRTVVALAVGAALAALPAAAAAVVVALSAPAARAALAGNAALADLLTALCGTVASLLLLALAGSVLLAGLAEAREQPGRRRPAAGELPARGVPAPVRRVVALVVGLAVGTGAASAASAAPRAPEAGWAANAPLEPGTSTSGDLPTDLPVTTPDPAWAPLPEPRTAPALPSADLPGGTRPVVADTGAEVVVQRGDSLWSLARALSGPDADAGDVLQEQQRLYAANADVIGADPDLLLPGQVLRLP
ncbi:LysM peptidoglycan-binding domain-containing protein [Kineococcus sp. SYSU DK018]|uniref:LysM peptidoglycan-binding domain-containing protein n=1 Tax=Kineococcus sp. SYSU DK018 TaxID=3383139 RepID=UPI003D7DA7CD